MTRFLSASRGASRPRPIRGRDLVRVVAVMVTVIAAVIIGIVGTADAATGTVAPIGTVTAGTPFSSGQTVQVSAPTGSGLPTGTNVTLVECAAPNGVLPTLPSQCDPSNTQSGDSINPAADGSFTYSNYQIYILPDPHLSSEHHHLRRHGGHRVCRGDVRQLQ